jgi:hypothetical protein
VVGKARLISLIGEVEPAFACWTTAAGAASTYYTWTNYLGSTPIRSTLFCTTVRYSDGDPGKVSIDGAS